MNPAQRLPVDFLVDYNDASILAELKQLRNRNTLEFIGVWEQIHNPNFKGLEFETFRNQAGFNRFSLTPRKWIEATNAIGFQSRSGRYGGGTHDHRDIAFELPQGERLIPFNNDFRYYQDLRSVCLSVHPVEHQ